VATPYEDEDEATPSPTEDITGLDAAEITDDLEENPDGSVTIRLEDSEDEEAPDFFSNLAETLPETFMATVSFDLLDLIERDKESRAKRDKQYEEGIRRTGMGEDAPGGAQFSGASRVVHPVMAECCVDFAASSIKEIWPVDGPVRTKIIGKETPKKLEKADRKRQHMNWQLTQQSPEFRSEVEQLLTQLPLGGSQYLKLWWDERQSKVTCEFLPIDNVYLPYAATNFYQASRRTVVNDLTRFEYERRVRSGLYRDVDLPSPDLEPEESHSARANDKIEGREKTAYNEDDVRRVFEVYTFLEMPDDQYAEEEPCPYIISIDENTERVLSVYRNWDMDDATHAPLDWIVEFQFIPWRGAYAVGLPQLIGSLSAALTGSLRALLDSAHINNAATLLKLKGARIGGQTQEVAVTQVQEIEGPPGIDDIKKLAMPMPFNPPSEVLFRLMGFLEQAAKGVVTTAEEKIADASNNGPVGTTQALIEQGSKVSSAIHARLHTSIERLLKIVHRLNKQYLDDETVLEDVGELIVRREDYDGPVDVCPVSDPHIFSETQRVTQTQAVLQLVQVAPPGTFDNRAVYKRMLEQLKVPNIKELLPEPPKPEPEDPVSENVLMAMGKPVSAFPNQEHLSHIKVLAAFMSDPLLGQNPIIAPTYMGHALEHLKQHLIFAYAQTMGKIVTEAAGTTQKLSELVTDDPKALNALAETFAAALPTFREVEKRIGFGDEVMQLINMGMQVAQKYAPKPPVDPAVMAHVQALQMETQRKAQADQMNAKLEAQKLQGKQQLDQQTFGAKVEEGKAKIQMQSSSQTAEAALEQQRLELERAQMELDAAKFEYDRLIAEQKNKTDIYKNDADNETALQITAMKIAADVHTEGLRVSQDSDNDANPSGAGV
jgi:hypothetical protein